MVGRRRRLCGALAVTTALVPAVLLAGCGGAGGGASGGAGGSTSGDGSGGSSSAGPVAGATDLTIVVDDGSGTSTTWRLTCDPPGGDHPDPARACEVLHAAGAKALPPVPEDRICTMVYGGPQTARITGTWRGDRVSSTLNRTNGCEIARWNALLGLLPKAGTT